MALYNFVHVSLWRFHHGKADVSYTIFFWFFGWLIYSTFQRTSGIITHLSLWRLILVAIFGVLLLFMSLTSKQRCTSWRCLCAYHTVCKYITSCKIEFRQISLGLIEVYFNLEATSFRHLIVWYCIHNRFWSWSCRKFFRTYDEWSC